MLYFYIVVSAALIPILNIFAKVLRQPYSWWLVPLLLLGFFVCFIIIQLAVFFISILFVNLKSESEKGNRYYRFLSGINLPLIFRLAGVRINVSGAEKIPNDKRILLVCNHLSNVDPAVFLSELPELELGFIAKKEVYTELPYIAKLMKKLYCLPLDRQNNKEAVKTVLKAIEYIKTDKASIGIFPEGTRSPDGELGEFKNGAFKIATKSKCPVVVCTLVGTEKVLKNIFRRKTEVFLDVVDVIYEDETSKLHTDALSERARNKMLENINKRKENI